MIVASLHKISWNEQYLSSEQNEHQMLKTKQKTKSICLGEKWRKYRTNKKQIKFNVFSMFSFFGQGVSFII